MGGLFGSIRIPGNRLTDLVGQTSTVGKPIPFGYGKCQITEPNVIWTAGIPKEHVRRKKQGKGGVKTEEYTYTLSYAIAFMAGPTFGYFTIKRAGKVVFTTDPNSPIEDRQFAAKWLQKATLYHGTEEQMPNSTIEAVKGAGQVSAFRGLAYIVVKDDDVTAEGGSVPQYEAVIIASPPDVYLTSRPYQIVDINGVSLASRPRDGRGFGVLRDGTSAASYPLNGVRSNVRQYYDIAPDSVGVAQSHALNGEIRDVLQRYSIAPDSLSVVQSYALDGEIKDVLLRYTNYEPEAVSFSSYALNGSKT